MAEFSHIAALLGEIAFRFTLETSDLNNLKGSTAFLASVSLTSFGVREIKIFQGLCIGLLVSWLDKFYTLATNQNNVFTTQSRFQSKFTEAVSTAIDLLLSLIKDMDIKDTEINSVYVDAQKQLNMIKRVFAKNHNNWLFYHKKAYNYCMKLSRHILSTSQRNAVHDPHQVLDYRTSTPCTSSKQHVSFSLPTAVSIPLSHLRRYVLDNLPTSCVEQYSNDTDDKMKNMWWNHAFETSGVLDLLQKILQKFQNCVENSCVSANNLTSNPKCLLVLQNIQTHLTCMESLHSAMVFYAQNDLSESNSQELVDMTTDTCSVIPNDELCSTPAEGDHDVQNVRTLFAVDQFPELLGATSTPPPSPEKSGTKKLVMKLKPAESGQKRIPWSIEESIALWFGVTQSPGEESWIRIWRQSFRQSGRTTIDLKDRWRTIKRSPTLENTISDAFERWKSKNAIVNKRTGASTLPIPVISRPKSH